MIEGISNITLTWDVETNATSCILEVAKDVNFQILFLPLLYELLFLII